MASSNRLPDESTEKNLSTLLTEYKLVINTQMHFNNMLLRYRTLAFTMFIGVGSIIGVLLKKEAFAQVLHIFSKTPYFALNLPAMIFFGLVVIWVTIFLVDYFYYFRLLLGAVERSKIIEKSYESYQIYPNQLKFLGMTTEIEKKMPPRRAHLVVLLFYILPLALLITLFYFASKSGG